MNCSRIQLLLAEYVSPAIRDPGVDWQAIEAHLRRCPTCAAQAAKMRQAVRLLQNVSEVLAEPAHQEAFSGEGSPRFTGQAAIGPASWQNSPHTRTSSHNGHNGRLRWLLHPAAALAACLAVSVLAWVLSSQLTPAPMADSGADALRIDAPADSRDGPELIGSVVSLDEAGTPGTQHMVRAGQVLAADRQQLALRIWDRHEVTLDQGARLTPQRGKDGGCLLKLSAGQICVAVNRTADEGIFRVVTPHADIAVTGTIFTVTATDSTTYLHVEQGAVEMTPSRGRGRLVSAGAVVSTQGVEVAAVSSDDLVTVLAAAESTVDLAEAIKHSPWYRQRFAPLLHLQDYLADRGVAVDELELLAISADMWCLQYPTDAEADLPAYIHRKAGLERAARWCGYCAEWLTPSSAAEAAALVADGAGAGDLMLAYGLDGQAVTVLGAEGLADAPTSSGWRYRFLTEPTSTAFAMCRIGPSERPVEKQQLVDQAVADVRSLLTDTSDRDYWVGREALQRWALSIRSREDPPLPDDLLLRSLYAVAVLTTAATTQEHAPCQSIAISLSEWDVPCRQMERALQMLTGGGDSGATDACRSSRRSDRQHALAQIDDALGRVAQGPPDFGE